MKGSNVRNRWTRGLIDHWDGSNLKHRLLEEMADLQAAIQFVAKANDFDPVALAKRTEEKLATFNRWHTSQFSPETVAAVEESRARLWAHIVSRHATVIEPTASLEDLVDIHNHEHEGPGTIRDHSELDRGYDLQKLGAVLAEAESGEV